jgi:flagellar export protein FliJ
MKGFKFKLDAVLKIRKLKEEQCKMAIGRIQVRMRELEGYIKGHSDGIDQAYQDQEQGLAQGMTGRELQFHPFFVGGKRAHIGQIEKEIEGLQEEVDELYEQLKQFRADVKVIDEMKEKETLKYKKKMDKKQFEELEEQNQNWRMVVK